MARSVLVIGAGIGGLSAGCYAAMNGFDVRVLEMHARPGGSCTAWTRHGFTFDGCIHNLAGSTEKSAYHEMWRELGILPAIRMHAYDELVRVERPDGEPFTVYTNLDRLEAHMKALFPLDHAPIEELISAARAFAKIDILGLALASPVERLGLLGSLPLLMKYGALTLEQFAQRFKDPFLRRMFPTIVYDWPKQSMLILLTFMGRCHIGDLGWPMGGSAVFAETIEQRLRALGGTVRYHAKVESILVAENRAVGVKLTDGSEERADIVISNANGHATIYDMLQGRYTNRAIREYYANPEDRIEMGIHVSFGLNRNLSTEPHAFVLPLETPVVIAGEPRDRLYVEPFGFDPSLAPEGKSPLKVVLATNYSRWQDLKKTPEAYHAEKTLIAETLIPLLEKRFPGIRQQIEVVDVATPVTTLHFTGNAHGYKSSIVAMILGLLLGRKLSQTLPGLENFYMVGQWAGAPGVPPAAAMGRDVVRQICKRENKPFLIKAPPPTAPRAAGVETRTAA